MTFDQLPEATVSAAKAQLTDVVAVGLAGRDADGVRELRELTMESGGKPEALIWGTPVRVPAHDAVRVNATMSHALDFDDTYEPAVLHAGVISVPAALAMAELRSASHPVSGEELLVSIAVGTDAAARMARAARPGVSGFEIGWHNTTLYGHFSTALIAARMLRLTEQQAVWAAGIAYHQAAGNSQAHLDGALTKRMGPGFASHAGVLAARLAQRGVRGSIGVLEGRRGLYQQYFGGEYSRDLLLGGLGTEFAGAEVAFKPWPSCRGVHTALDATLRIMADEPVVAEDVDRISVWNGPGEYPLLSSPLEQKRRPRTVVDAQFSVPWVVSAAVVDGAVTLAHLSAPALGRSDLLAVAERVTTFEDPSLARPGGGPGAARVELRLRNGRTLSTTVTHARGEPGHPMSSEQARSKFDDCVEAAKLPADYGDRLLEVLDDVESLDDVRGLVDLLAVAE